jgi:hypothetical protein
MKIKSTIIAIIFFVSCGQAQKSPHDQANIHKFTVDEVLQTTSYTYLLADQNGTKQWLAMPRMEAVVGEVYYFTKGPEMKNFKSAELDRTFASVLFLGGVQSAKSIQSGSTPPASPPLPGGAQKIKVSKANDGITIAELFANKSNYSNKKVTIKGEVVKYNGAIMGKNWIHLQDGTKHDGENDLTITTDMVAKVGDTITVVGVIILDKDFGSGYFYKIIMEEAKIIEE